MNKLLLKPLAIMQYLLNSMPNPADSKKTSPRLLQYAVEATVQHEKQISRLVARLDARKDELVLARQKMSADLDALTNNLDKLQKTIDELVKTLKAQ
jgi:hypothetical protein